MPASPITHRLRIILLVLVGWTVFGMLFALPEYHKAVEAPQLRGMLAVYGANLSIELSHRAYGSERDRLLIIK